jgi:hypothetical protein
MGAGSGQGVLKDAPADVWVPNQWGPAGLLQ